jgi:hypothetical protein
VDRLLAESLERLIRQSAEVFGPEHPSTLMLRQQLEAARAAQDKPRRVFWLKQAPRPPSDEKG